MGDHLKLENLQQIEVSKPLASPPSSLILLSWAAPRNTGTGQMRLEGTWWLTDSFAMLLIRAGMYHKQKQLSVGSQTSILQQLPYDCPMFPQAVSRCQHLHYQKKKFALKPWHVNSDLWNSSDRVLLYSTAQALLPNIPNVEESNLIIVAPLGSHDPKHHQWQGQGFLEGPHKNKSEVHRKGSRVFASLTGSWTMMKAVSRCCRL